MQVEVYLKSGQSFKLEADNITVTTGRLDNDFRNLQWSNDDGKRLKDNILYLDGSQVDAVVTRKK